MMVLYIDDVSQEFGDKQVQYKTPRIHEKEQLDEELGVYQVQLE